MLFGGVEIPDIYIPRGGLLCFDVIVLIDSKPCLGCTFVTSMRGDHIEVRTLVSAEPCLMDDLYVILFEVANPGREMRLRTKHTSGQYKLRSSLIIKKIVRS